MVLVAALEMLCTLWLKGLVGLKGVKDPRLPSAVVVVAVVVWWKRTRGGGSGIRSVAVGRHAGRQSDVKFNAGWQPSSDQQPNTHFRTYAVISLPRLN
jgi:hypothetical protein